MIDEKKLIQCLKHDISCFETEGKKVSELDKDDKRPAQNRQMDPMP